MKTPPTSEYRRSGYHSEERTEKSKDLRSIDAAKILRLVSLAQDDSRNGKEWDAKKSMKKITQKQVVDELAAIGFARATNFLSVSEGELTIRNTDTLSKADQAAIASI